MEAVRIFLLPFLVSAAATTSFAVVGQNGTCVPERNIGIPRMWQFVGLLNSLCGENAWQANSSLEFPHKYSSDGKLATEKKMFSTGKTYQVVTAGLIYLRAHTPWTHGSNKRKTAETWHETWVQVREAVQSVQHTADLQPDGLTCAVSSP